MCLNLFLSDAPEPPAELRLSAELQEGLAQGLVPVSARGLALGRPGLKNSQKPGCRHLCDSHILMALVNELNYSLLSEKWKMHEANDSRQCLPEVRPSPDGFHTHDKKVIFQCPRADSVYSLPQGPSMIFSTVSNRASKKLLGRSLPLQFQVL